MKNNLRRQLAGCVWCVCAITSHRSNWDRSGELMTESRKLVEDLKGKTNLKQLLNYVGISAEPFPKAKTTFTLSIILLRFRFFTFSKTAKLKRRISFPVDDYHSSFVHSFFCLIWGGKNCRWKQNFAPLKLIFSSFRCWPQPGKKKSAKKRFFLRSLLWLISFIDSLTLNCKQWRDYEINFE